MPYFKSLFTTTLLSSLLFCSLSTRAETDPWYATQPSCVIKDADPGRTGNYNADGIKEFHGVVWQTSVGNNPVNYNPGLLCYEDKIFYGYKAYDEKTGKLVWEIPEQQKYSLITSAIYKGHLYLAVFFYLTDTSKYRYIGIQDINITTKKARLLHLPVKLNHYESINMLPYNDVLYISFSSGNLIAYSLKANKTLWYIKTKSEGGMELATDGERLFSQYKNGIAAYDMKTGKKVWSFDRGSVDIIYKDGTVYTESMGGVWALNAKTGKIIWDYLPDNMDERQFAPIHMKVSEPNIFFTNNNANDNNLYILDRSAGTLKKKISNLFIIMLHKNELYVDYRNSPIKENSIKILDVKQDSQLLTIQLPGSTYEFPNEKTIGMLVYDKEKKETNLTLIN